MAKDTRWDRNLSVAPDADGRCCCRKLADQCDMT